METARERLFPVLFQSDATQNEAVVKFSARRWLLPPGLVVEVVAGESGSGT